MFVFLCKIADRPNEIRGFICDLTETFCVLLHLLPLTISTEAAEYVWVDVTRRGSKSWARIVATSFMAGTWAISAATVPRAKVIVLPIQSNCSSARERCGAFNGEEFSLRRTALKGMEGYQRDGRAYPQGCTKRNVFGISVVLSHHGNAVKGCHIEMKRQLPEAVVLKAPGAA